MSLVFITVIVPVGVLYFPPESSVRKRIHLREKFPPKHFIYLSKVDALRFKARVLTLE